jgi:hypothetical protein
MANSRRRTIIVSIAAPRPQRITEGAAAASRHLPSISI